MDQALTNFDVLFMVVLFLSLSILSLFVVSIKIYEFALFRTDPTNPYRRFCKKCGQCQEEYGKYADDPRGWWEVTDAVIKEKCRCHLFAVA